LLPFGCQQGETAFHSIINNNAYTQSWQCLNHPSTKALFGMIIRQLFVAMGWP